MKTSEELTDRQRIYNLEQEVRKLVEQIHVMQELLDNQI